MVIYVDVLIFTNIIIDYILLFLTEKILKFNLKLYRVVLASIVGGVSSLYILLSVDHLIFDLLFKLVSGILIILIALGRLKIKLIFSGYILFLMLSFAFNGLIYFLQNNFSNTYFSQNLVSYINISPVLLIVLSSVFYLLVKIIYKIIDRKTSVSTAHLTVYLLENVVSVQCMVDSGHTLTDPLSDSQVFILDGKKFDQLTKCKVDISNRKRVIPIKTVGNSCLLEGVRCDMADVIRGNNKFTYKKPIVLRSQQNLVGTFDAIISKSAVSNIV